MRSRTVFGMLVATLLTAGVGIAVGVVLARTEPERQAFAKKHVTTVERQLAPPAVRHRDPPVPGGGHVPRVPRVAPLFQAVPADVVLVDLDLAGLRRAGLLGALTPALDGLWGGWGGWGSERAGRILPRQLLAACGRRWASRAERVLVGLSPKVGEGPQALVVASGALDAAALQRCLRRELATRGARLRDERLLQPRASLGGLSRTSVSVLRADFTADRPPWLVARLGPRSLLVASGARMRSRVLATLRGQRSALGYTRALRRLGAALPIGLLARVVVADPSALSPGAAPLPGLKGLLWAALELETMPGKVRLGLRLQLGDDAMAGRLPQTLPMILELLRGKVPALSLPDDGLHTDVQGATVRITWALPRAAFTHLVARIAPGGTAAQR